jgi:hypothetical protein
MSLRLALSALPGDRESIGALRLLLGYLDHHQHESLDPRRIGNSTGAESARIDAIVPVLVQSGVVDFDGDSDRARIRYAPDRLLDMEVRRFLRSFSAEESALRRRVDRFRDRFDR